MAGRLLYRAARPILFRLDPEWVHERSLTALSLAARTSGGRAVLSSLGEAGAANSRPPASALGLTFRNRIGLAAGFDKDGRAIRAWAALGFGFVELGTVTARAQPGNRKPRLFRLSRDQALINRMGFNNHGADALARRIAAARRHLPADFRVGVSIGRGARAAPGRDVEEYAVAYRAVAPHADYVAINVSSPNTAGLRDLEEPRRLAALLRGLTADRTGSVQAVPPLLVKLSPDLDSGTLGDALDVIVDAGVAGVILTNTTTSRRGLHSARWLVQQGGGLSGRPLREHMLRTLAFTRERVRDRLTIVASGGLFHREDAIEALYAGASLLQVYTGFVYRGPGIIGELTNLRRPR